MGEKLKGFNVKYFDSHNRLSPLGQKIVQSAQKAASEAIAGHKAVGNAIYYKERGQLIKELANGTRYFVKASKSGIETIRKL